MSASEAAVGPYPHSLPEAGKGVKAALRLNMKD